MPRITTCAACGKAVGSLGWVAMPARVENGVLAGAVHDDPGDPASVTVLGEPVELCDACVPARHPLTGDDGDD